jgi:hypothetical protein
VVEILPDASFAIAATIALALTSHRMQNLQRPTNVRMLDVFRMTAALFRIDARFSRRLDSLSHNQQIWLRRCRYLLALHDVSIPSTETAMKAVFIRVAFLTSPVVVALPGRLDQGGSDYAFRRLSLPGRGDLAKGG